MMPEAIEPAMPRAFTKFGSWTNSMPRQRPRRPPMAPSTAVGWKPALWIIFGATRLARHMSSTPTAMPRNASFPAMRSRSQSASTAGTMTAPAWIGPPSKVSSKSSPCAAVPLTNAAPPESSARAWPIAVQPPEASQPSSAART